MFRIDPKTNRITKLKEVKFSDLGFGERSHLQEWLANQPDAFGEDLLVIQKEFAGFDDTRERLDLLALDKQGALVVIENKLDDSGRDVVWQCVKYASYCSVLSKTNIAKIYQEFLDRTKPGSNAQRNICDFLAQEDFDEVVLNSGENQRLILVAAQFRKEVTSTALWLLKHGVRVQCFKATPFQDGRTTYLNLAQLIPLPEAQEMMIGISEKEKEEQSVEAGLADREILRMQFWEKALEALKVARVKLYEDISPSYDHWINAGSGIGGAHYALIFNKDEARVEFGMTSSTKERNKALFDYLVSKRAEIEKAFGAAFDWRRLDGKKASIVAYGKAFEGYKKENWPEMIQWQIKHIKKLEKAISPQIGAMRQLLKDSPFRGESKDEGIV